MWPSPKIPAPFVRWGLIALCAGVALAYLRFAPSLPSFLTRPGPVVDAPVPTKVERIVETHTITVPGPVRIRVIEKEPLLSRLKMPELKLGTDNIVAVGEVAPHTGKTTVIARMATDNSGTASVNLATRQEPTPFFQVKRDVSVSGRYMFTGINRAEVDLAANPLRIGPVEVEAGAGVEVRRFDSSLGVRSWVGATYRF